MEMELMKKLVVAIVKFLFEIYKISLKLNVQRIFHHVIYLQQEWLVIGNISSINRAYMGHLLAFEPATQGHKKGPVHRWRAFEVRLLLAHDTSHAPLSAVVVVVEVQK